MLALMTIPLFTHLRIEAHNQIISYVDVCRCALGPKIGGRVHTPN
jgi:hypothetical protein